MEGRCCNGAFGAFFSQLSYLINKLRFLQLLWTIINYIQLFCGIMDGIDYEFKFDGIDCYLLKFKIVLSTIIIFSLYLYLVSDQSLFMKITPIGGSGYISWVSLWWVISPLILRIKTNPDRVLND